MAWTDEQNRVIISRNANLLVSAAAGSGKTSVLVERILSVLTDPELDTIGEITALFYTVEFTMENNQKVIVRTALTGRDNRLYAFQHLDFQRTGDSTFLRKILAGLVWA